MALLLYPLRHVTAPASLAIAVIGAAALYVAVLVSMNFFGLRDHFLAALRRQTSSIQGRSESPVFSRDGSNGQTASSPLPAIAELRH
jgi:hypothetical protein